MLNHIPNPHPIHSIVAYTADLWDNVLPVLRYRGPAASAGVQVIQGNSGPDIDTSLVDHADLVLIQRDFPRFTRPFGEIILSARNQGKAIVYEIDDLLLDMPTNHVSYPDQSLYLMPMLWAAMEADLITTTTPALAEFFNPIQPQVHILPNYLNDQLWKLNPVRVTGPQEKLVIGYMGGRTHLHDLEIIAPVLSRLLHQYPDRLRLHFWGCPPPQAVMGRPEVAWTPLDMRNYAEFAEFLSAQKIDIALAPLEDHYLNKAKSAIKFLEYSAVGAAGIYSRLSPYDSVIEHGRNGFLASTLDEWETHLATMIEQPILRENIAKSAQETVRQRWLLKDHAAEWLDVYQYAEPNSSFDAGKTKSILNVLNKTQDRILGLEADRSLLVNHLRSTLRSPQAPIEEIIQMVHGLQTEKDDLLQSRSWKMMTRFQELRQALIPYHSRRERILQQLGLISASPGLDDANRKH